jgi:hypothetical protein
MYHVMAQHEIFFSFSIIFFHLIETMDHPHPMSSPLAPIILAWYPPISRSSSTQTKDSYCVNNSAHLSTTSSLASRATSQGQRMDAVRNFSFSHTHRMGSEILNPHQKRGREHSISGPCFAPSQLLSHADPRYQQRLVSQF